MKVGQPVSINVDALLGREFRGHVESFQVRKGSVFTLLPPESARRVSTLNALKKCLIQSRPAVAPLIRGGLV